MDCCEDCSPITTNGEIFSLQSSLVFSLRCDVAMSVMSVLYDVSYVYVCTDVWAVGFYDTGFGLSYLFFCFPLKMIMFRIATWP